MRIPTRRIGSPNACVRHRRAHVCVGVCARGSVWVWAPRYLRRKRAKRLHRRGPRAARLAGVRQCAGVQREHRRVEHRRGHDVAQCMRRFRPGGAPPRRDALGLSSMRRGCCARRHRRCARLCTHTRIGTWRSRAADTAMHMFNSRSSLHIIAHSICSYMVIFIENRPKYGSPLVHAVHACACVWPRVAVCARMGLCRHVSLCMNSYRWVRCILYIEVYTSAGV